MQTNNTLPLLNIAISAGHSTNPKRDRGAASGNLIEGDLAAKFRKKLILYINNKGYSVLADSDDTILADSLKYFTGKTNEKTIVLDLHFNAATANAKGVETIIPSIYSKEELQIAGKLSSIVSTTLETPLRGSVKTINGVKTELETHHGKLGWMRISGINVLVEFEFITNPTRMATYVNNEDKLVQQFGDYLIESACKILNNTFVVSTASAGKYYVVKAGDTLSKIAVANKTTMINLQKLNNINDVSKLSIGQRLLL